MKDLVVKQMIPEARKITKEVIDDLVKQWTCQTCGKPAFAIINFEALDHKNAKRENGMVELEIPDEAQLQFAGQCSCPDVEHLMLTANDLLFQRLKREVTDLSDGVSVLRMILDEAHGLR